MKTNKSPHYLEEKEQKKKIVQVFSALMGKKEANPLMTTENAFEILREYRSHPELLYENNKDLLLQLLIEKCIGLFYEHLNVIVLKEEVRELKAKTERMKKNERPKRVRKTSKR